MHIDGPVVLFAFDYCRSRKAESLNAPLCRCLGCLFTLADKSGISECATHIGMVRQHHGNGHASLQCCRELADVTLHVWAIGSQEWHVNPIEGVCPEILVLHVDKVLRIAERFRVQLGNALNTVIRGKTVCVCRDRTSDLHQAGTLYWRRERVFWNEQPVVPLVSLHDIVPALAEIAFHVPQCGSFDDGVSIVPVVRSALLSLLRKGEE